MSHTISLIVMAVVLLTAGCAAKMKEHPATKADAEGKRTAMDLFIEGKLAESKGEFDTAIASYMEAFQYDTASDEIATAIARSFLKSRKMRSAVYFAEKAVKLNPGKAESWRMLQQLYQHTGRISEAADALSNYIKLSTNADIIDHIWLAKYKFELGRDDEGKKIIMSIAGREDAAADELTGAANILAEEGYQKEAEQIYNRIIERDPMDVRGWLSLGESLENQSRWNEARETYSRGLAQNPDSFDLTVALGNLCLYQNDWDCAISYFEKASVVNTDVPKIRKTLAALYFYAGRDNDAEKTIESIKAAGEDDASFYFSLGKSMNWLDRYDDAVSFYRDGFAKPLDGIPEDSLFMAVSGLARSFIRLGRHDDAVDLVREGAPKFISNREGLKLLEASMYSEMKRFDDAISIYEWLLASDPNNIRYILSLGQVYNNARRYDDAEKTFLRVRDVDPDNLDYLIQLSIVYDFTDQFGKAENALEKVLSREPNHALALNNLAYMYIEHDTKLSKAIEMAESAIRLDPVNGAYHDTLGWAYYKKGKYKKAREYIENALKWEDTPDKGVIFDHYGDILVKLGDNTGAVEAYRKAIELGEDVTVIQGKIDTLTR